MKRALWLLAALTVLAVIFASQLYVVYRMEGVRIAFRGMLLMQLAHWYLWAIAGPIAWWCANRWPLRSGHRMRGLARQIAIATLVSAALVTLFSALAYAMPRLPFIKPWFAELDRARSFADLTVFFFSAYFHIEMLTYASIFAIAHAARDSRELRAREHEALQLSSQLTAARLQVLTAQLQPHFLFNTLHTIGSLILQRKNDDAMQMLAELGELLRITLHRQTAESIPLSEELDHLKRYLHIEEARFGDRLTVGWEVAPEALSALVPPLILQPLVENALKHGVAARIDRATLVIRAAMEGGRLRVSVRNDGPTLPASWALESATGFGLRNVHERLLTRGGSCTLRVENAGTQGVLATIDMPAQMVAADA